MAEDKTVRGWINPLAFLEAEEWFASATGHSVGLVDVVDFLCQPGISVDIASICERYHAINLEGNRLPVAPADERILAKLIWPLRHAKGCYMLGNYLGTVSLCGMVAEMLSMLVFDMIDFSINGKPLDDRLQQSLFGCTFEKLGQDRRVNVLCGYGLVTEEMKGRFDQIRTIRKRYLHFYSQGHEDIASDAVKAFGAAADLVVNVLGISIRDGRIVLNPVLDRYLTKLGVVHPSQNADDSQGSNDLESRRACDAAVTSGNDTVHLDVPMDETEGLYLEDMSDTEEQGCT